MGALSFIRSFLGGNPREVVKLGKGGAGAVNPPTTPVRSHWKMTYQKDADEKKLVSKELVVPKFCRSTFLMIARKKGATVSEIMKKTGKTKGTVYQEIALIKKSGVKIVRAYEKPVYRFRVG
jgi:hypothetical protein